jgi:tungstate transport system ATP-binding protein
MTLQTDSVALLELHDLCFSRDGRTIIDSVSMSLNGHSRSILLGSNGAGKSVLMRLMHGLLEPTAGYLSWSGSRVRPQSQAMVFQRPVMLRCSVLENLLYALQLGRIPRSQRRARALRALGDVGLVGVSELQARLLSGGEQQKLALARACLLAPKILFLDEPTASLDPRATAEIEALILHISSSGTKIVMSTHSLGQARRLADDIVFLDRGRVLEHAPATQLLRAPESLAARAYIESELPWKQHEP